MTETVCPLGSKSPRARISNYFPIASRSSDGIFREHHLVYTYKARGAFKLILDQIATSGRNEVLLPAFNCPSIVQTVLRCGLQPVFYPLGQGLRPDVDSITQRLSDRCLAVLAVHYFGFESDLSKLVKVCHIHGIPLIEDWSHSFLQAGPTRLAGSSGDYAIYSFWKIVPTGIGGAVRVLNGNPLSPQLTAPPWSGLFTQLRDNIYWPWQRLYDRLRPFELPGDSTLVSMVHQAQPDNAQRYQDWYREEDVDFDARLPSWAMHLLQHFDYERIISVRRENYQYYAKLFSNIEGFEAVFPQLADDTCPWAFPVYFSERNQRARFLRSSGVPLFTFGETLHPLQELSFSSEPETAASVRRLIDTCLCLPLHQDISTDMIDTYATIARDVIKYQA